jgi:hypothetical protein
MVPSVLPFQIGSVVGGWGDIGSTQHPRAAFHTPNSLEQSTWTP